MNGSVPVDAPPGSTADEPGNVVTQVSWPGLGQDSLQAAMLRVVSTLKKRDVGSQSTPSDPLSTVQDLHKNSAIISVSLLFYIIAAFAQLQQNKTTGTR